MAYADFKNDFVFRRIFGNHPNILRGLLNDLLERQGAELIESLEYLPSEQLPLVDGAKFSILDVRCRDRAGTTFVVEMQLLHVPGFGNRVVYNACKAYVDQLRAGQAYTRLNDVVALSICDFELWPDAAQDAAGQPRVPMLSRWHVSERSSRVPGLLQVQYAFLELPKLPPGPPQNPRDLWAWLFVHAPELQTPPDLPAGPFREAASLANEASFNQLELDAYRRVMDEIQQTRDYGDTQRAAGRSEGEVKGRVQALLTLLNRRGLALTPERRARVEACSDLPTLERWFDRAISARSADELFHPADTLA